MLAWIAAIMRRLITGLRLTRKGWASTCARIAITRGINQGVRSVELEGSETSHIEHDETAIHNEARRDRAANGGYLTAGEHNEIEHQQTRDSRQIYNDKRNAKTAAHPRSGASDRGRR